MESFYSTLKTELIHRHTWATRAEAQQAMFELIEVFYDPAAPSLLARLPQPGRIFPLSRNRGRQSTEQLDLDVGRQLLVAQNRDGG